MKLLIYSFDAIYYDSWEREATEDNYYGEKEFLLAQSTEDMVQKLYEELKRYGSDDVEMFFKQELNFINTGSYTLNEIFLTIHGCYDVNEIIDFDLKDTDEFKKFVKEENERLELERKYKEECRIDEETEIELAELKRLKAKYEN